jgi:hypothetical protein
LHGNGKIGELAPRALTPPELANSTITRNPDARSKTPASASIVGGMAPAHRMRNSDVSFARIGIDGCAISDAL